MKKITNAWDNPINAIHILCDGDYKLVALLDSSQHIERYAICKDYLHHGIDTGCFRCVTELVEPTYYGITDLDWAINDLHKKARV